MKAQWTVKNGLLRCAWCDEEQRRKPDQGASYGICDRHRNAMINQAVSDYDPLSADEWQRREKAVAKFNHYGRQTKRPDQVSFSATVFFVAFAITVAVVVGAWLWRVCQ